MVIKRSLVCGVGVNDADYPVYTTATVDGKKKVIWSCPFYSRWKDMLKRCYSAPVKLRHPTYTECEVIIKWHSFMAFRGWMVQKGWEGKYLDKDIIIPNNKIYSPETCVFVSEAVNDFILERRTVKSENPVGVYKDPRSGRFQAKCANPLTGKQEHVGCYESAEEAHQAWLDKKTELAYALASEQSDPRVAAKPSYYRYRGKPL